MQRFAKFREFVQSETKGWTKSEIFGLIFVLLLILVLALVYKDSSVAVISSVCGILYTIIAGKGKISCYFFGLCGSGCYSLLAFQNALWGNLLLYLCYYIPMQIIGIFQWKKHIKKITKDIIKTKLQKNELAALIILCLIGCSIAICLLFYFNDKCPVIDGITAILSIAGMYLTVKRCIEQWIIWMIVNGLSLLMWTGIVHSGTKAYATVIMWGVYFVLAVYFYLIWKKEVYPPQKNSIC